MRKITRGIKKGTFNQRELEVIQDEVVDNTIVNNNENGLCTQILFSTISLKFGDILDFFGLMCYNYIM